VHQLAYVRVVADLEVVLGFRSKFNFIPESYQLDHRLVEEKRIRGFEISVHGLKHDGMLLVHMLSLGNGPRRSNLI
jgi:hypothetical protein